MMRTALLAAVTLLALGCRSGAPAPSASEAPPLPATVVTASAAAGEGGLVVNASVEPIRRAMPATVLMGRVLRIARREGEAVRRGETLAVIDARDVEARRAQAEAGLAAAKAQETNARAMLDRMRRLVDRQAASKKNLEDAELGHEAAAAGVKAAEEAVAAASVYTGYANVTAPFDGVVVRRNVEAGDLAAPGMPLFVVEDLSRVKIEASLPESDASGLRPGDPVRVESDAGPIDAEVAEVLPAADPRSRTFTVRSVVANAEGLLRSGAFARVRFPSIAAHESPGVAVPGEAVVRRGPLTGVFVVDAEGIARLRWVTLGAPAGGAVDVLTGLEPGARVVSPVPEGLEDGRRIAAGSAR